MALHEQCTGKTDEWYTPPHVFDALGCRFDTDVASPGMSVTPWIPASRFIMAASLETTWTGFVWMNPPFGGRNALVPWLDKFFAHGNGIALTPDRTSAPWWQQFAPRADLILFVAPKLKFIGADGKPGTSPAQGTCLMGVGARRVRGRRDSRRWQHNRAAQAMPQMWPVPFVRRAHGVGHLVPLQEMIAEEIIGCG